LLGSYLGLDLTIGIAARHLTSVRLTIPSLGVQVFFCSASPAIRYPNVYGIDMPVQSELIAFGREESEIAEAIKADWVVYQVHLTLTAAGAGLVEVEVRC
jgi:glutamine phosphoribosylpyrophosphate amidotransferase